MPASRSARAMIFAPRSCPSSPGFATTTRIFRSAMAADSMGLRDLDRHMHVGRVDRADDLVGPAPAELLGEVTAALERRLEVPGTLLHDDVVRIVARPVPSDDGALVDRHGLGLEEVVADLDVPRPRGRGRRGD